MFHSRFAAFWTEEYENFLISSALLWLTRPACPPPEGQAVARHADQGRAQTPLASHAGRDRRQRQQPGVGDAGRPAADRRHPAEPADALRPHGASGRQARWGRPDLTTPDSAHQHHHGLVSTGCMLICKRASRTSTRSSLHLLSATAASHHF